MQLERDNISGNKNIPTCIMQNIKGPRTLFYLPNKYEFKIPSSGKLGQMKAEVVQEMTMI